MSISSERGKHNFSQKYQKFKINLARGTRKHHMFSQRSSKYSLIIIEPSTPKKKRRGLSQKSHGFQSEFSSRETISQMELTEQIKFYEEKIKQTKHNLVHERLMNETLREENENLRETNKILNKQDQSTASSSLPMNARVAENIYENYMINDLKTELSRVQEQITRFSSVKIYKKNDIGAIKKDNKAIKFTIEEVKKYHRMLVSKTKEKLNKKQVKVDELAYRR